MKESVFRKSSLERVSSPEQLNDYIRISNPGVWMVLAAAIILLVGACVWGVFGTLETTQQAVAVAKDGTVTCYVTDKQEPQISQGMTVRIGKTDGTVASVAAGPFEITSNFDSYAMYLGNMKPGEWYYPVTINISVADGYYMAQIVTSSKKPMSFVLN
jgi:hypothetical protein